MHASVFVWSCVSVGNNTEAKRALSVFMNGENIALVLSINMKSVPARCWSRCLSVTYLSCTDIHTNKHTHHKTRHATQQRSDTPRSRFEVERTAMSVLQHCAVFRNCSARCARFLLYCAELAPARIILRENFIGHVAFAQYQYVREKSQKYSYR